MKPNTHCGFCGAAFAPNQPWPRTCAGCARTSYRNPVPVAVCLLPIDDGLLCVRRTIPPGVGRLALPGGYIDFAETWQQAAARELFEETGLRVDPTEIEHVRTLSSDRVDGVLLVFGRARPRPAGALKGFTPTPETSELVVIREATDLAFPLHTQVVAEFFTR
ncbi:NADH pyrophosphatase [Gemmata obscuriglobus]|uniref:NUDIX domain-containing protein n=1 Tax=Gemmata obscuriglobus TaxID=114 RepID=A0A2Z3H3B9_9BACT|nr:NUDIX domain-containing protein [Gemmata obscuriglobus]AWM36114.1 NUDIX domain-containing protein [Gemmata obscuriglobus]QEG31299.1 NADH pyrophosphatase [Gemmata obscuriglobus]VTS10638.1 nudix hydrolase : NUDIX hydrolase, type 16 OS=Pelobacter carbinolicus (strain DSM 2380 / Gra Bd 1) GN=Pcar_2673 PE=4 SV=1: NUDIX [Gemmata obscuriglobus UQM 2246]